MTEFVVAVDGPAASGKSSVSKAAAARLGFAFLDTGAAYRALAWFVVQRRIPVTESAEVVSALADFDYRIGTDPAGYAVWVGEHDVTDAIREPEVSAVVSSVAKIPEVRRHVNEVFRRIVEQASEPGIIVEGRDITTVVAPDAPVRILLTASEQVRMARRAAELTGEASSKAGDALRKRDAADSLVVDFMTAADGVTTLDSSDLTFDETVDAMVGLISAGSR